MLCMDTLTVLGLPMPGRPLCGCDDALLTCSGPVTPYRHLRLPTWALTPNAAYLTPLGH